MNLKICVITGANSGIGKAAAIQIAQKGYRVILACRNREKGEAALEYIKQKSGSKAVGLMIVDMSQQASIRKFSKTFLQKYQRLDVLIQNAAIFDISQKVALYTDEGIETIWATNHIGPVLLTDLLLPALKNGGQGRIITIASKGLIAKPFLKVDLADPEFKNRKFSVTNAYYQSKRAQIMFTYWLAKELARTNLTVNCIRVPAVRIDMNKYPNIPDILKKIYAMKSKNSLSPDQMASTYTFLATSDEMSAISGKYYNEKNRQVKSNKYSNQSENITDVMRLTQGYIKSS